MKFIIGIITGIVLIPVLIIAYLASGYAPTAATDKPLPGETWLANTALSKRMQKEAPTRDVTAMTTTDLIAGADIYKKDCAVCHGLPDQSAPAIANGMFPPAPQLMRTPPPRPGGAPSPNRGPVPGRAPQGTTPGRGASGDFWRVKNGIRLTGMPSFGDSLTDDQIWQVVAMIASRRNMLPEVKADLLSEPPPVAPTASTTPAPPAKH
jgi:thiosulfate dehydrogenase